MELARDEHGRVLGFSNTSPGGGFQAFYPDTHEDRDSHECWVRGVRCYADEARFGGIVIEAYPARVSGVSLKEKLRQDGSLDVQTAVSLCAAVAVELENLPQDFYGQLAPVNIVLQGDEGAGITVRLQPGGPRDPSWPRFMPSMDSLTNYMAPEQLRAERCDATVDVYALGCVMFECLTGGPPFGRHEGLRAVWAHLDDPPPDPCTLREGLATEIAAVILQALGKSPDQRPLSASVFASMLAAASVSATSRAGGSGSARRMSQLVDAYARRVYPAVLGQHPEDSVSSPLGMWLTLAACAIGADAGEQKPLEEALGCSAGEARELLARFMVSPPHALAAAIAVWVDAVAATPRFAEWIAELPDGVETGLLPSRQDADDWVRCRSLGLIHAVPTQIHELSRFSLVSVVATKVSWRTPFAVVQAGEYLGERSPWRGTVNRVLLAKGADDPGGMTMIAATRAAGLVAVYQATAVQGLVVLSVSAAPDVTRLAVLEAASEIEALLRGEPSAAHRCSLFDLPVGQGHSWEIVEREIPAAHDGERIERVDTATLPAWRIENHLDLLTSELFAMAPALDAIRRHLDPNHDGLVGHATQVAATSYSPHGFEGAAATEVGLSLGGPPRNRGLEGRASLRFDHPHAAIALVGQRPTEHDEHNEFFGLPVFSAWIQTPVEVADDAPVDWRDVAEAHGIWDGVAHGSWSDPAELKLLREALTLIPDQLPNCQLQLLDATGEPLALLYTDFSELMPAWREARRRLGL
jgi:hypothetical protein